MKVKYMQKSELNKDQIKVIKDKGWCIFTECDCEGSHYIKGVALVNRIGYIIFSENVDTDYISSYKELNKIASEDFNFDKEVRAALNPIEDKCYVFLVKNPARYTLEQVWTNKGLTEAKNMADARFKFEHIYFESKDLMR